MRRHLNNASFNMGANPQVALRYRKRANECVKKIVAHPKFKDLSEEQQAAYLSKAGVAPKEEAKTQAQIALDMRTGQNVGRA
eukprot:symbB.v1.2.001122.t1/scaffold46.1/size430244/13